jgi:cystathionine gamma-synthase
MTFPTDSSSDSSSSNSSGASNQTPNTNTSQDHHPQLGLSTKSVHAGEARQKPSNAITDSICCSSTYTFESTESILNYIYEKQDREEYGRYGNPNEKVVERKLAALDCAEDAIIYSSGMASIVGLLMTKLSAGDGINATTAAENSARNISPVLVWLPTK